VNGTAHDEGRVDVVAQRTVAVAGIAGRRKGRGNVR
jgi:hypothetical protein